MSTPANVMVLAGEASGDLHGARMVAALKQRYPDVQLRGMGSERLRAAGVELLVDCRRIAVVGLFEVLRHWPEIKRALRTIESAIDSHPPDVLVLIDYVEFNLRMAAVAKRAGVKVLFYVSPQIWAWRPERVHKIGALIDRMAVIFPFEVALYERAGVPVRYVGHPLSNNVRSTCSRADLFAELGIAEGVQLVGLLPGSRSNEIRHILPALLDAAVLIKQACSDVAFAVPVAPGIDRQTVEMQLVRSGLKNIHLLEGRAYDVMACADSIAIASGTATLEAAIIGVPMAIVYRVSALSWLWMKRKLLIEHVGLANIVAGKDVVPELIQSRCRGDLIAQEIVRQLSDSDYVANMRHELSAIKTLLGVKNAAAEVADMVSELLEI